MGCVYGDKGVDDVIAVIIDGTSYYYHKDHLGSIVGITDSNGNLVSTYEYDSFGNFQISGTDIGNDRLFTGREYDRETGLYYYRARYYDSNLGRFISRDPIDVSDNVNLYTYVGNNPVMFSDPSGLKEKKFIKEHDATKLLEKYMKNARDELSFGGYFPKWGYSQINYGLSSLSNKWNIKYNKEFQNIAFNPIKNNESCQGYGNKGAGGCKVYVNGEKTELSEIGNYLIGYNGAYAGFTLNSNNMGKDINSNKLIVPYLAGNGEIPSLSKITTDIYEAGMRVEFSNHYNKGKTYDETINSALTDELEDRVFYDKGYNDAFKEIRNNWGF